MTGKIIKVLVDKNFGFIRSDENGREYFFHKSELRNEREFNQRLLERSVTFEDSDGLKGPRAENVYVD